MEMTHDWRFGIERTGDFFIRQQLTTLLFTACCRRKVTHPRKIYGELSIRRYLSSSESTGSYWLKLAFGDMEKPGTDSVEFPSILNLWQVERIPIYTTRILSDNEAGRPWVFQSFNEEGESLELLRVLKKYNFVPVIQRSEWYNVMHIFCRNFVCKTRVWMDEESIFVISTVISECSLWVNHYKLVERRHLKQKIMMTTYNRFVQVRKWNKLRRNGSAYMMRGNNRETGRTPLGLPVYSTTY